METTLRRLVIAVVVLVSGVAAAGQPATAAVTTVPARDRGQILIAPKLGVLLPYGFSSLRASYLVGLELGYALPVLRHRLAVTLAGEFTAPEASGTGTDPRLDAAAGAYSWHLSQRELILGVSLVYRHRIGRLVPYAGVGPRLFLLDSRVEGAAGGATISQSSEVSTKVGAGVPVGLGVQLGPGDLFAELELQLAPIDHRTTGSANSGSLSLALGYRLVF
jgi:hypothetical protein